VVREISTQTAEGSKATAASIGKLAALSAQLRKSVAGFRLPDYGGGTTTMGATSSTRLPTIKDPAGAAGTDGSGGPSSTSSTGSTDSSAKMRKASGFSA
jgi:hypothetical protein